MGECRGFYFICFLVLSIECFLVLSSVRVAPRLLRLPRLLLELINTRGSRVLCPL